MIVIIVTRSSPYFNLKITICDDDDDGDDGIRHFVKLRNNDLLQSHLPPQRLTARELLRMPPEEIDRYLAAAVKTAVPFYAEDLARPVADRELTAFTALDGEPFL